MGFITFSFSIISICLKLIYNGKMYKYFPFNLNLVGVDMS